MQLPITGCQLCGREGHFREIVRHKMLVRESMLGLWPVSEIKKSRGKREKKSYA